jgi:D-glycero-D-manno-heptose 1,7-bisphosphate phosphatase
MKTGVFVEREPLGTAGCLHGFADRLEEDFLLVYGDVFLDLDLRSLMERHTREQALATLLVRASDHPWDSHLVDADDRGRVRELVFHQEPGRLYRNVANAALYVLSRHILRHVRVGIASDFGRDVFPAALRAGGLLVAHPLEPGAFVKDMGTPDRLEKVERHVERKARAMAARDKPGRIRHVLFDRDGTLNENRDLVARPEDLVLLPGAGEAVALLNASGIDCAVVTNQPVIARGLCDEGQMALIHDKLRREVAAHGGGFVAIYHSPYHPETHHGEGVRELRRASDCRKPEPGMLFRAAEEHGWDLAECVMVGDTDNDRLAAAAAGMRFVGIGEQPGWREAGVRMVAGPLEAAKWILGEGD